MTSCTLCNTSNSLAFDVQFLYNKSCTQCATSECQGGCADAKCVLYNGPSLVCSTIEPGDSFEVALQKIDVKICETSGDYSGYSYNCVANPGEITTEAQFVEAITSYACQLRTDLDTFISTTFTAYQQTVEDRFIEIENPEIECESADIETTDTLQQIYGKYCTKFGQIDTALSLSGVNWDQCFSVPVPPTTIAGGFNLLIDQICQVNAGGGSGSLPEFNNVGSCLDTPGADDSLEDTVIKIRTRLCLSPVFDINALTWTCITKPSTDTTDLQAAFQALMTKVDTLSQQIITQFSGDFNVSLTDGGQPCLGKSLNLATPLNQDRLVASNVADTTPGTLIEKLQAGTNITLDDTTTPGKVIINASGTTDDKTVKANVGGASGFLDDKLKGGTDNGININVSYSPGDDKIAIEPEVDISALAQNILTIIDGNEELRTILCQIIAGCPSPCDPPQNAQAIFVNTTTTTTTTTTA